MKLLQYYKNERIVLAVRTETGMIDLEQASVILGKKLPLTMKELFENREEEGLTDLQQAMKQLEDRFQANKSSAEMTGVIPVQDILHYAPCVTEPEKIICIGLNYGKHAEETKGELPATPILFSKFANALAGHQEIIRLPADAAAFDYEAELVIVIGKTASNVREDEALSYVFGYTAGNDLSARDLQFRTGQWLLGKTADGFAPIGPWIVTADEIENPNNLEITCKVNGQIRQASTTKDMIFSCAQLISYISRYMTLKPGDIIFTGTPEGVILGYPKPDRVWLKAGDKVEVTVSSIGTLANVLA